MVRSVLMSMLLTAACVYCLGAQESKKVKAWVIHYDFAFDIPDKKVEEMTSEEKQMMAMMELGKAFSGGEEGEALIKAYVTEQAMRVEQGGLIHSIQISNLLDSTSYNLYAATKTAYRVPLASPKISTDMVGDSLMVVSSADAKIRFTDDTMKIAGYLCKKALMGVSVGDTSQDVNIWYAEGLPKLFWGEYDYLEEIPGLAMKISTQTAGMGLGVKVSSVEEALVDDTLFNVPADYTIEDGFGFSTEEDAADIYPAEEMEADSADYELAAGYYWTDDGELWGVEDENGKVIVEPRYHDRYGYTAGLAPVSRDGLFGVVDKMGRELVPLQYDGAFVASENRIWVMKDGLYGLIDTDNHTIIPASYQTGSLFSDGLAFVQKEEKYGFVDEKGKVVIPFLYDEAAIFFDGRAWVKQGEEEFYINKEGKRIE